LIARESFFNRHICHCSKAVGQAPIPNDHLWPITDIRDYVLTDRKRCKTVLRLYLLIQAGNSRLIKTSERRFAAAALFLGSL
jgi:hypothetical protein